MPRASLSRLSSSVFRKSLTRRECLPGFRKIVGNISSPPCSAQPAFLLHFMHHIGCGNQREHHLKKLLPHFTCGSVKGLCMFGTHSSSMIKKHARDRSSQSIELDASVDVIRFNTGNQSPEGASSKKRKVTAKKSNTSRKAKLNELRFYRLKARKKMKSPNPEVRLRYKLEKAKRKEAWLIEKLRKYELPKAAPETYDPEILTEEERFYLRRTGEKKKNYVLVGRRGVFGGVVLNMHLHWKKHETVKVICKPCRPGQVDQYAEELARLSNGIIIDKKPNNTIMFYRGKNYVRPDVMSPPDTLSKAKALEKYRYEQSLEHTSEFIEKLENELAEYLEHLARYKKEGKLK